MSKLTRRDPGSKPGAAPAAPTSAGEAIGAGIPDIMDYEWLYDPEWIRGHLDHTARYCECGQCIADDDGEWLDDAIRSLEWTAV